MDKLAQSVELKFAGISLEQVRRRFAQFQPFELSEETRC